MAIFSRRSEQDDAPQAAFASNNPDIELEEIRDVIRRASLGDLDARVSHVNANSHHAGLADDVNRFLDLVDSYLRESQATLTAAAEGRSYRRFLAHGMLGAFTTNAQKINDVIETFNALRKEAGVAEEEASTDPAAPRPTGEDEENTPQIPHTAW